MALAIRNLKRILKMEKIEAKNPSQIKERIKIQGNILLPLLHHLRLQDHLDLDLVKAQAHALDRDLTLEM